MEYWALGCIQTETELSKNNSFCMRSSFYGEKNEAHNKNII